MTCTVENNIPYLEGGSDENVCPGVERPTQAVDGRLGSPGDNIAFPNGEIDEHATPRGDDPSQNADTAPQGGEPNVPDDDGNRGGPSHNPGDVEPVYSRDFRDTANEALEVRRLATRTFRLRVNRRTGYISPLDLYLSSSAIRSRWTRSSAAVTTTTDTGGKPTLSP